MLRRHKERKTYSADIKHRTFGRVHVALKTKVREVATKRHAALQLLLDTGEPVRDLVVALRAQKLTIEAVTECVRAQRTFDALRPSTWPLLGEAVKGYVEMQEGKEGGSANTANGSGVALKHAEAFFGKDQPLDTITYERVTEYKAHLRAQGLADNTVALYMLKFGALYTYLQKRETRRAQQAKRVPFVLFSPVDRDEHMPPTIKTRSRYLVEQEAERLLEATPVSVRAAVALGLFAGLRIGEVMMLRVGMDVDLERGTISVQARDGWVPKYKRNRDVPISSALEPYLVSHLAALPAGATYVFPGRSRGTQKGGRTLQDAFRRAVGDAEIADEGAETVTFHTLRHTFASWLVMAGADLFTVARLMGHANTKQIEETYAHLSPEHRLATVEMLSTRWLNREAAK